MRRRFTIATVTMVLVVGGVSARAMLSGGSTDSSGSDPRLPPATAEITRTTLVETKTLPGTLGYGEAVPIGADSAGTLTWIAATGSTVKQGEPLFKVDEQPVVALYGPVPMYRALAIGAVGADVTQLEEDLTALGYGDFTADDTFTPATATAVRAWQTDLGLPVTGTVEPGQVVFTPGPIRVAEQAARVGARVGGETVLSYTGTTRVVTVELEVVDQALAVTGGKVTATIPGGTSVEGTIAMVGTVATAPPASGSGEQDETGSGTGGQSAAATSDARIPVTLDIPDQLALGTLEGGPVDVDFVNQERANVLAVPVAALLALPQGGYGVEIVQGRRTRTVAVRTGLFAGGRVEISGGGIQPGMKVGMPK